MNLRFALAMELRRMSRTLIALALRRALACKGYSVRALGQTQSDLFLRSTAGKRKDLTDSGPAHMILTSHVVNAVT